MGTLSEAGGDVVSVLYLHQRPNYPLGRSEGLARRLCIIVEGRKYVSGGSLINSSNGNRWIGRWKGRE